MSKSSSNMGFPNLIISHRNRNPIKVLKQSMTRTLNFMKMMFHWHTYSHCWNFVKVLINCQTKCWLRPTSPLSLNPFYRCLHWSTGRIWRFHYFTCPWISYEFRSPNSHLCVSYNRQFSFPWVSILKKSKTEKGKRKYRMQGTPSDMGSFSFFFYQEFKMLN